MINILDLSNESDRNQLREFSLLEHPSTFRYFKNRVFEDAIRTHIVTIMYSNYGYAHIDKDTKTNRCYLGICVLPEYQRQGIGRKLIETLLKLYTKEVYLTVDKDNLSAISLYRQFGFVKMEETDAYVLYKRAMPFQLEVSMGEIVDKLTILDIKLEKISNPVKQQDCKKERNAIMECIEPHMNSNVQRFHTWLKYINTQIWELQDELREGNASNYTNEKFKKILDLNDMRFRVKKRINALFETSFQEQKGYSERVGIFLCHLGMGDLINLNGAARYCSLMVDKLYFIPKMRDIKNVRAMFQDDPTIHIIENCNDDSDAKRIVHTLLATERITHTFFSGIWCGRTEFSNVPFDFYDDLGLAHEIRKIFAYFPSNNTLVAPDVPFIFTHSTSSSTENMAFQLSWDINEILTIDPNRNYYPRDHKWFGVAESYLNKPIFSYINVIEQARQIHVTDSSFYCLCCFLKLKADIKLCYDRQTGNVSTLYKFN